MEPSRDGIEKPVAANGLEAGTNATLLTSAQYTSLINQAEAFICVAARTDYVTSFDSLSAGKKELLTDAASSHAAISVINNDMSGFTSREEAQVMIDVNWAKVVECINLLRDETFRSFLDGED